MNTPLQRVLDRLEGCRTAFSVERIGASELDPLQVSILRFLISQVGPCLVDWGDMQIVLSEDVLLEIDEYPSAGALGEPGAPAKTKPGKGKKAQEAEPPGLSRSTEIEAALEAVTGDPFLRRRFVTLIESFPDFVERYVALIEGRGAMGDAAAAKELGMDVEKLAPQLSKLHKKMTELASEADED